jgi:hypothetical protein
MIIDIQTLSNIAGLVSFGAVIVGGVYMAKGKAGKQASDAQQSAISALQAELTILRQRVADTEQENIRLRQTIDTICSALKVRGQIITIQGEMINIADQSGNSTTARIHGTNTTP